MTSKSLQCVDMDLSSVVKLYTSLELYICELRNNFETILNEAISICEIDLFPNDLKRQKKGLYFLMKEVRKILCFQKKKT